MADMRKDLKLEPEVFALLESLAAMNRDKFPIHTVRRLVWSEAERVGLVRKATPKVEVKNATGK